jgi:hypothetical protein
MRLSLILGLACVVNSGFVPRAAPFAATHGSRRRTTAPHLAFPLRLDLGDGTKFNEQLPSLFSRSCLITVRLPVPFELHAASHQGVLRVTVDGSGMREGDVLRCCTTYRSRMSTNLGLLPTPKWDQCLFLCDGQPHERVVEALVTNTAERTDHVLLILERPAPRGDEFSI